MVLPCILARMLDRTRLRLVTAFADGAYFYVNSGSVTPAGRRRSCTTVARHPTTSATLDSQSSDHLSPLDPTSRASTWKDTARGWALALDWPTAGADLAETLPCHLERRL